MKLILWLHLIYLCSKARISFRGINLRIKTFQHEDTQIKYVGLIVVSPKSNTFIQLSGMSAVSFNLALKKAFSEFLESLAYWKNISNMEESRSGMATHESFELCYENAYQELMERDSFIMHLYCPDLSTSKLPKIDGIEFVKLQSIDSRVNVVLARAFKGKEQLDQFISLAASYSLESAIEKAKLELIMLFNEAPDFSEGSDDILVENLRPHYLSMQSKSTVQMIDQLIAGGGGLLLDQVLAPEMQTVIHEELGSFVTLKLSSASILKLKFSNSWKDEYETHFKILVSRGLNPAPYLVHPLL